jgi:putative ubiquitin-RnfH superfamily antitoxin RatB of RatAB toxin-antitoxin module
MSAISVEVVYARAERQELIAVKLPAGSSVQDALAASGLLERFPEIEPGRPGRFGIFGRPVAPSATLRDGDRVEIYRPLVSDPKETRRRRAQRQKRV